MFLEGEINWVLALGVVAAGAALLAIVGLFTAGRLGVAYQNATSALHKAEDAAARHEKRLFQILGALPVALVETDTTGKFVFANRAAHQLLGRRDSELLGLRFHSATWGITYPDGRMVPPDLLPAARALRGQTVKGFQHVIMNPNSRKRMLVSVTAMPILNDLGEVVGSTAALVEIETLATPKAAPGPDLMRQVFDAAASLLLVVGADGALREANIRAAETLALIGETGLPGDWINDLVVEADRAEARAHLDAAVRGETGEPLEQTLRTVDGRERRVRWRMLPLADDTGRAEVVLLAGEDVTDRPAVVEVAAAPQTPVESAPAPEVVTRSVEDDRIEALAAQLAETRERLAAAQARREAAETAQVQADIAMQALHAERRRDAEVLEQAQRHEAVGRLTGGVAQDFNSLLTVINGALDLILRRPDEGERVKRLGEAALAAGRRGERLTRQLLAFARREDPQTQTLDMAALASGLEPMLRQAAQGAPVELAVAADVGGARVDPVQFEAALTNLLANAVEAAGTTALVTVSVDRAAVETDPDRGLEGGDYVRVTVRDRGPGFSPEALARAAEPFFTTREGHGRGLGLAQAHGFARQAGGVLVLSGAEGAGAVATLLLPAVALAHGDGDEAGEPCEPHSARLAGKA